MSHLVSLAPHLHATKFSLSLFPIYSRHVPMWITPHKKQEKKKQHKSRIQFPFHSQITQNHVNLQFQFSLNKPQLVTMEVSETAAAAAAAADVSTEKHVYSVWALPPDDVAERLKRKVMEGLRSEFGGPQFEPHITVVGAISLTADDALEKFRSACDGLKAYNVTVDRVATGTFFYQCVFLLIRPTPEVMEASAHCTGHFGYKNATPYMPHLSLLYADLSDDEKKKAQDKANALDESLDRLSFPINRLALYKTDTEDKTCKSWEKVAECNLKLLYLK